MACIQAAKEADIILLSQGDLDHLGALPYLAAQGALQQTAIFATHPVARLGQMVMFDQQIAQQPARDFVLFDLDDIDAAFGQIRTLKYHQTHRLKGEAPAHVVACMQPCMFDLVHVTSDA